MEHDPLCPLIVDDVQGPNRLHECQCEMIASMRALIAKVRKNERSAALQRVDGLPGTGSQTPGIGTVLSRAAVIAAIKGEQP